MFFLRKITLKYFLIITLNIKGIFSYKKKKIYKGLMNAFDIMFIRDHKKMSYWCTWSVQVSVGYDDNYKWIYIYKCIILI